MRLAYLAVMDNLGKVLYFLQRFLESVSSLDLCINHCQIQLCCNKELR